MLLSYTNSYFADMGKFMKPGKVVMVLAGRYAGRKAVIVKVLLIFAGVQARRLCS